MVFTELRNGGHGVHTIFQGWCGLHITLCWWSWYPHNCEAVGCSHITLMSVTVFTDLFNYFDHLPMNLRCSWWCVQITTVVLVAYLWCWVFVDLTLQWWCYIYITAMVVRGYVYWCTARNVIHKTLWWSSWYSCNSAMLVDLVFA